MQGKPPDWQDFIGIIVLLIINSTISFIEENNAGNAAAALMAGLAPKTKVHSSLLNERFNHIVWLSLHQNRQKVLILRDNAVRYVPNKRVKISCCIASRY